MTDAPGWSEKPKTFCTEFVSVLCKVRRGAAGMPVRDAEKVLVRAATEKEEAVLEKE